MTAASRKAPISRDPAAVTARILDAAQAEFVAQGYEAASTNRIVAGFGGSKATLFRHYPTKQALLGAVVARIAAGWEARIDARTIPDGEPGPWLTAFATGVLDWILGDDTLFVGRLGIAEGRNLPELAGVFHAGAGAPLQAALAERLEGWTRDGLLACPDAAGDARRFFDLVIAGEVSRTLYGAERLSGEALLSHVADAVTLFLHGRAR